MAPDKKDKKRKAASTTAADSPAKKTKKVEAKASEDAPKSILKKSTANGAATQKKTISKPKVNGDAPRPIKPRKRAADFLSDDDEEGSEAEVEAAPVVEKDTKKPSSKKSKQEDGTATPAPKEKTTKASKKADIKANKTEKVEIVASDSEEEEVSATSDASEGENEDEDDQTTALIRGFESSGDEDESADEGLDPDAPVPKIPDSKKAKRKILKLQKQNQGAGPEESGTVYVGRIPHGFYEHQMRAYFSQFGEITKLRLSRNRITGRSKHYAFIEFNSKSVAKIVAATMDNYLMYGHILKCKYVPSEQLHPEIWKGANRRFKRTPWNLIEKRRLAKGKTREQWKNQIKTEKKRRVIKAEKLKTLGYEFEMPELMSVDTVPFQEPKAIEEGGKEATIEDAAPETEQETAATDAPVPAAAPVEEAEPEKKADGTPKKAKKGKKEAKSPAAKETPKSISKASPKPAKEVAASPATRAKGKGKPKTKAKA